MGSYRKERLEEAIKRIVATSLISEIKDPRVGFVTVTNVELNRDKSIADVYISILGDEKEKKSTMAGLKSARGFMQYKIGKNIRLRNVPKVRFFLDSSIEYGTGIVDKINKLDTDE